MNRGQLRTLVLSWLDDPNGTYFTPAQVNVWLNNAQKEAQKQLVQAGENWYVSKASTTLIQNQDTYSLPLDFLKVNKLAILLSGVTPNQVRQTLTWVTLIELDQVSMTTGTPACYTIRKNCLVIRPIPDNTNTLYLDYTYLVADMNSDLAVPDVPTQYQEYLAVLATIDGFLKDQRDPSPMLTKKDYYLSLMKQDAENRNVDQPRMVVVTEPGSAGYLF